MYFTQLVSCRLTVIRLSLLYRKVIRLRNHAAFPNAISCMNPEYWQDSAMNNNLAIINQTLRRKKSLSWASCLFYHQSVIQTDHRSCQSEDIMRQAANGMSELLRRRPHSSTSHPVLAFQSIARIPQQEHSRTVRRSHQTINTSIQSQ